MNRVLTHTGQIKSELIRCLIAEFLGTLLFQIFGGAAPPKDTTAPAANGFALVAISECTLCSSCWSFAAFEDPITTAQAFLWCRLLYAQVLLSLQD